MKKNKIIVFLGLFVSNIFFVNIYAYNFDYNQQKLNICDITKWKIDNLINSKIKTLEKTQFLLKKLDKYNPGNLDYVKKWIYFYIKYALEKKVEQFGNSQANLNPNFWTWIQNKASWSYDLSNYGINNTNTSSVVNTTNIPQDSSIANQLNIKTYTTDEQLSINRPFEVIESNKYNSWPRINTISSLSSKNKDYINSIKATTKDYVEIDDNREFEEYNKKYMLDIKEYWIIEFNNPINTYLKINWVVNEILFKKWNEFFISKWWYNLTKKLTIKELVNTVKLAEKWDENLMYYKIKDWYYYSFDMNNHYYFKLTWDWIYPNKQKLEKNIEDCLLFKKWDEYMIADKYEEKKLFPTSLLNTTRDPKKILDSIIEDVRRYSASEIESNLTWINNKTQELFSSNIDDRILNIYKFITKDITYDKYTMDFLEWKISESIFNSWVNKDIYSWLMTYKNKNWVCDWLSKLFQYMLVLSWIEDSSIEVWKLKVNSQIMDHARNKIGNYLYDVTIDTNYKWDSSKFKYYKLTDAEMYKDHFR